MSKTNKDEIGSGDLFFFTLLAFALSWVITIPLALANQGIIPALIPSWTHYLAALGPMISAFIVTGIGGGLSGLQDLGKRMLIRQICPRWWIVAFSPFIFGLFISRILNRFAGGDFALSDYTSVPFLPSLGFWVLLFWILIPGMGGETGWRGFALPRLQKDRSALGASLVLSALWALWHLPQFFYLIDPSSAALWLVGLFAGAVFLTWLYNSAIDSIPTTAIWMGSYQFIIASSAGLGIVQMILIGVIVILTVIIVIATEPKNLMSI